MHGPLDGVNQARVPDNGRKFTGQGPDTHRTPPSTHRPLPARRRLFPVNALQMPHLSSAWAPAIDREHDLGLEHGGGPVPRRARGGNQKPPAARKHPVKTPSTPGSKVARSPRPGAGFRTAAAGLEPAANRICADNSPHWRGSTHNATAQDLHQARRLSAAHRPSTPCKLPINLPSNARQHAAIRP